MTLVHDPSASWVYDASANGIPPTTDTRRCAHPNRTIPQPTHTNTTVGSHPRNLPISTVTT